MEWVASYDSFRGINLIRKIVNLAKLKVHNPSNDFILHSDHKDLGDNPSNDLIMFIPIKKTLGIGKFHNYGKVIDA